MSYNDMDFEDCGEDEIVQSPNRYSDSVVGTALVADVGWESPAEREFAKAIAKYLASTVSLKKGENVRAVVGRHTLGPFRPDIVLSKPGRMIGLEVDGKQFHTDPTRDGLRDSALVLGKVVASIYRFAASVTWFREEDCMYLLSKYEPSFFDARAREVLLPRLASNRVRAIEHFPKEGVFAHEFPAHDLEFDGDRDPVIEPAFLGVTRIAPDIEVVRRTGVWIEASLDRNPSLPFDSLIGSYQRAIQARGVRWGYPLAAS